MKNRLLRALFIFFAAVFSLSTLAAAGHAGFYRDRIYPGVRVENVPVGGLTRGQAERLLDRLFHSRGSVTLKFGRRTWRVTLTDLGAKVRAARTAEAAFSLGRDKGFIDNLSRRYTAWSGGQRIPVSWNLDQNKAGAVLTGMAKEVDQPAVDAKLNINGANVSIIPHQDGRKTLIRRTLSRLKSSFFKNKRHVYVAVKQWRPATTTQAIKDLRIEKLVAEFSTSLSPARNGRRHNIELATGKLNDVYIKPGAVFSFNETVGPRTKENGYQNAPVIERGNLVDGIGGGICQVATTLYNTAMLTGLPVIERSLHSNFISNYPAGRDATVADGLLDLKFKNDTGGTLLIRSVVLSNAVVFRLYGPDTGRTVWFSQPEITNVIPYSTKIETDTSLPAGVRVVAQKGVEGKMVKVSRKVTNNEKKLIEETIASRYSPRQEIIRVGPAPEPTATATPEPTATPAPANPAVPQSTTGTPAG